MNSGDIFLDNHRTAVVIATYNGAPWIRRCLNSLRTSTLVPHVIVVDNASTDNTTEIVKTDFPETELIQLDKNHGFGFANNAGIRRSIELDFTYTFLLNQDAFTSKTTIQQLTTFLANNSNFDIVSPLHCSPDFHTIDKNSTAWHFPRHARELLSDSLLGKTKDHYQIYGINAAAWFVRTRAFLVAGGFDPIFFMYGEDDDLLARFSDHGLKFAILPSARIVHLRESASKPEATFLQQTFIAASRSRSNVILDIKNPHFSIFHMLLRCVANGMLKPFSNFLIDRNGIQFVGSLISALKVITEIPAIRTQAKKCATPGPHFLETK